MDEAVCKIHGIHELNVQKVVLGKLHGCDEWQVHFHKYTLLSESNWISLFLFKDL